MYRLQQEESVYKAHRINGWRKSNHSQRGGYKVRHFSCINKILASFNESWRELGCYNFCC